MPCSDKCISVLISEANSDFGAKVKCVQNKMLDLIGLMHGLTQTIFSWSDSDPSDICRQSKSVSLSRFDRNKRDSNQ